MGRRPYVILSLLVLATAIAIAWNTRAPERSEIDDRSSAQTPASVAANRAVHETLGERWTGISSAADRPLPPAPASLDGTAVDGELTLDAHGRIRASAEVRRFFDYFLSAAGEERPEDTYRRIVAAIQQRLQGEAAIETVALLDRYLEYRRRLRLLYEQEGERADPEQRLASIRLIRRSVMGEVDAEAMFGLEERYQRIALERRRVLSDGSLSPDDRDRRLEEISAQLPADARASEQASVAPLRLYQEEQALRAAGGEEDEVEALRRSHFGAEAAQRLAQLDREQAAWQRRLETYQEARREILSGSLAPAAREQAVRRLKEESFTETERLRVD